MKITKAVIPKGSNQYPSSLVMYARARLKPAISMYGSPSVILSLILRAQPATARKNAVQRMGKRLSL